MYKSIRNSVLVSLYLFFSYSGFSQIIQHSDLEPTIYEGSTVVEDIYSPGLEGNLLGDPSTQPVKIYLPTGYDHYPNNEYPVLYLLHGHDGNYNSFYSLFGIQSLLDDLISSKVIVPMIVVTPNGTNKYTGCMYRNSYVSGHWEDFIVRDVIQNVESKYSILNQTLSRGLCGHSSGGYGALVIAMKHPYLYSSLCAIATSLTSFADAFLEGNGKATIIEAAGVTTYNSGLPTGVIRRFSNAVAFAPDSAAKPALGRFPFSAEGEFIDSTWQKWLMHDPYSILQTSVDSMLKLNAIQMYAGNGDFLSSRSEMFHEVLDDHEIEHGFDIYTGDHDPTPVLDDMLIFFSEHLTSAVPNIRIVSGHTLHSTDTLRVLSDMDGAVYIVPDTVHPAMDSIIEHHVESIDVSANVEKEIMLSDFDGNYLLYAISSDNMVSNIPEVFSVIPDTTNTFIYPRNHQSPEIEILPNPVNDIITIQAKPQGAYEIEIIALNGQQVYSERMEGVINQIDLSSFQKGTYFITIRSKDFVTTRKIIKL